MNTDEGGDGQREETEYSCQAKQIYISDVLRSRCGRAAFSALDKRDEIETVLDAYITSK